MAIRIGLTLPNRGEIFGAITAPELVNLAEIADQSEAIDDIWVGDSLLAKPRLESISLLSAIAARTSRVRIGAAFLASFPLRDPILLADQWASLDLIAEGRTILVASDGIGNTALARIESEAYGVTDADRIERTNEGLQIIRRLWREDNVSFGGKHYQFEGVTVEPKPQIPGGPPIWLSTSPPADDRAAVKAAHQRIVSYAEGWHTSKWEHADIVWRVADLNDKGAAAGKKIDSLLYHNLNITEDVDAATTESKQFLDQFYGGDMNEEYIRNWVAQGTPEQIAERIRSYEAIGVGAITFRITSWNQRHHLERLVNEVLPLLA